MKGIEQQLLTIRQAIARAAQSCDRDPLDIQLLAVSKTRPAANIRTALACGQRDFGESYVGEALEKIEALAGEAICWHFIGPIQSNKSRLIAEHFDWVHSVDRLKVAQRLNQQRPHTAPPLNICLQVNISGEASKSGVAADQLEALAEQVSGLERLQLRGLMAIPRATADSAEQRRQFAQLRELLEQLSQQHQGLDTLSMGMSADMESAIAEGATWVRIGTGIFGPRITTADKQA